VIDGSSATAAPCMCGSNTTPCSAGQFCNGSTCGSQVQTDAPTKAGFSRVDLGCWTNDKSRFFSKKIAENKLGLDGCQTACIAAGSQYVFMAYEYKSECYCGLLSENYKKVGSSSACIDGQGGSWAASVYQVATIAATPAPTDAVTDAPTAAMPHLGCWTDSKQRVFGTKQSDKLGLQGCKAACLAAGSQYIVIGYEYNTECYCGTASDNYKRIGSSGLCKNGVGGSWALDVYGIRALPVTATPAPVTATPAPVPAVVTPAPVTVQFSREHKGCWTDAKTRFFSKKLDNNLGLDGCQAGCVAAGSQYVYMAYEYKSECYCGTMSDNYKMHGPSSGCQGGVGGSWSGDLYQIAAISASEAPTKVQTDAPTPAMVGLGCWTDNKARLFDVKMPAKKLGLNGCRDACLAAGSQYIYIGYEYNSECYCGIAGENYQAVGTSNNCMDGVGGSWAMNVYGIRALSATTAPVTPTTPVTPATPAPVTPTFSRVSLGCWTSSRDRAFDKKISESKLGLNGCQAACKASGSQYVYISYEYNSECYCGLKTENYQVLGSSTACKNGVGGSWSGNVYQIAEIPTGAPVTRAPVLFNRISKGCWADDKSRVFEKLITQRHLGLDGCQAACTAAGSQFVYIMYQYKSECWCGTATENYEAVGSSTACENGLGGQWSGNVYQIRTMRRSRV